MESFQLSLSLTCSGCQHPLPVNRIAQAVACPACGEEHALPLSRWAGLFEPELFLEVLEMELGTGRSMQVWGSTSAKLTLCRVPLPEDDEPRRPACELVRGFVPGALAVLDEEPAEPLPQAREPVFFACLSCSAGLKVDGTERMVSCQHCEASCYLPDGLWRELNPVPKLRRIRVLCDISEAEREQLVLQHGEDDQRLRLAETTQDIAVLESLAVDEDEDVQLAVVERAETPRLRLLLADARRWEVRRALARREDMELALLERLAEDSDGDVCQAAKQNPIWREAHPVQAVATPKPSSIWTEPMVALVASAVMVGVVLLVGLLAS